jgi:hypothetical protein
MAYGYNDDYNNDETWRQRAENGGWGGPTSDWQLQEAEPQPEQQAQPSAPPADAPPPPNPFDPRQQVGHNGTLSNGWNREQYRDAWMGSGVNSVQGAKDWIAQHGGEWLSDNGTVRTPFGETLDMLINGRGSLAGQGPAKAGWGPSGGGAPPPPSGLSSGTGTTGVITGGSGTNHVFAEGPGLRPPMPPVANPEQDARKKALMDQLTQRMQQDLKIDRNDPIIRNQADTYSANAERSRRNYLSEIAEGNSPYATGAMRNEQRMSAEKLGQNTAGFEAQLMGRELAARREEIQSALDSMGNLLTESERQQLQRELADADNALRKYGMDTQNSQFYANLSQADKHFYDQLSQQDRLALMDSDFRNRQLDQSDSQWRDKLGFDTSDRQSYWDAVRRGLL